MIQVIIGFKNYFYCENLPETMNTARQYETLRKKNDQLEAKLAREQV